MVSLDNICPSMQVAKGLLQIYPQDVTQVYWVLQIAILENTHKISCIS